MVNRSQKSEIPDPKSEIVPEAYLKVRRRVSLSSFATLRTSSLVAGTPEDARLPARLRPRFQPGGEGTAPSQSCMLDEQEAGRVEPTARREGRSHLRSQQAIGETCGLNVVIYYT